MPANRRRKHQTAKDEAMANQQQSPKGVPHPDRERPSPDVEESRTDGQSHAAGKGAPDQQGRQDARGDGPHKVGLASDDQPDLVAPSGVNERDHGAADDKPMGGGSVNLDDDDLEHPRGNTARTGGTWGARGGDSAPLGPPGAGLSNRNGPSDPDHKKQ
jgi:hypothetical protein